MKINKKLLNNLITYGIVIIAFIICQSMVSAGASTWWLAYPAS